MSDELGGYAVAFGLVLVCWFAAVIRVIEILLGRLRDRLARMDGGIVLPDPRAVIRGSKILGVFLCLLIGCRLLFQVIP